MNRRNFLKGCLAASIAPAFIKSESLMALYVPKTDLIYLDDWIIDEKAKELIYNGAARSFNIMESYSVCKKAWMEEPKLMTEPFPLTRLTDNILRTENDYKFSDSSIRSMHAGTLEQGSDLYCSFSSIALGTKNTHNI